MARAPRLLRLLALLRQYRHPVSGQALAEQLDVSLRTVYRDIATLQEQGADITGEAGVGYLLRPGFLLPPLMFSPEELEALALGCRWVMQQTDEPLADAAHSVLSKVATVLPPDLRETLESASLLIGPSPAPEPEQIDLVLLRDAIRRERKLDLSYQDGNGSHSQRIVWPVGYGLFARVRVLIAWCEARQDFRHFRTDRIQAMTVLDARMPQRRRALLAAWRKAEGIRAGRFFS